MTTISAAHGAGISGRNIHLRIINISNGQLKVELCLPISLIGTAQRLGAHVLPPNTSLEALVAQARTDGVEQLAWVDEAHGERLELTLE